MIESTRQEGLQFISKVAEFLPLILYVYDLHEEKVVFSNRLAKQLMGETKEGIYAQEGFFFNGIQPSDRSSFSDFLAQCQAAMDDMPVEVEYRLNKLHESERWYHQRAIVFSRCEDGSPRLILNMTEDISDRKQNEETLLRFSTALKMTSDSVLITDLSNQILDANDSALKLYGVKSKEELVGRDWFDYVTAEDHDSATEGMRKVLMNGFLRNKELKIQPANQPQITVEVSISIITNASRAFVGLVIILRDISERKKTEEKLRFISSFDALTRVYNRFSFQEKVLEIENGDIAPLSVMMIDADGLKKVNDNLGHSSGDEMLVAIAEVLKKSFRSDDFIARIGGDEFVVLLPGAGAADLERATQRLRSHFITDGNQHPQFTLSVSIGGYTVEKGEAIRLALFYADEHMYEEKAQKKATSNPGLAGGA
jgi:diguanylate cyclase (GGDEF)-like protein/PAS domain S-box-containing protein